MTLTLTLERQAPIGWVKVPLHVGQYGNEMADQLADLGVQKHGVQMKGQQQQALKRQVEWAKDRGNQALGSQGLASRAAEARDAPSAQAGQPHAGGGVQRLMFITYVALKSSGVTKATDMHYSSPTAQGPWPCRLRRLRTSDS